MTDLEKLETLFNELGIGYVVETEMRSNDIGARSVTVLKITTGETKVTGYFDFYTEFCFNPEDGSFIEVGIWE